VSRLEVEALYLAEWSVRRGRTLVLCPADPLARLPELIAAAVHVADMAEQYTATGVPMGSSRRVAVVTSDYHARGTYRSLGVRKPHGLNVESLRAVVPAGTLGRDRVVRILGRDQGRGWATVFVQSIAEAKSVGPVDLVVVELSSSDREGILDLEVPTVIVMRDPSDPFVAGLGEDTLVFGWDDRDLARIRGDADLPPRVACRAAGAVCEVVPVPAHAVCENAALFWEDVGPLVRSTRGSIVAREVSREAFSLFHDLLGLALPVEAFELATVPFRVRLDAIANATRLARGDARDLYLPMVEAELRDLARALGSSPPKYDVLIRALGDALEEGGNVMLIARTAALARLCASELARHPSLSGIRVTSLGAVSEEAPAEVALLTGMAPTWARWVYRAGLARFVRVLAYEPEGTLESSGQGFSEVKLVRRAVADQLARERWFARPAAKDRTWSALTGEPRLVAEGDGEHQPRGDVDDVAVLLRAPAEVPPGLWDGDGWLVELEPAPRLASVSPEGEPGGRPIDAVLPSLRVTFEGGRWSLLDAEGTVTRFRPGSGRPEPAYPVHRLAVGDRVLFFDGDSRKDLLSKVLEVAEEVPALALAAGWVGHWRRVLSEAYRHFGTYEALTEALHRRGCTVQTQTVRLWVIGVTIGPDDEEDVHRVGIVTGDAALFDRHLEVCRAMRSLRGAHVRLGHRLSELARQVGSAVVQGRIDSDEVMDERSGLTAADFQDSVDILTVTAVEPVGEVPYLLLGRLTDAEEEDLGD
jgi:hypothetical protein